MISEVWKESVEESLCFVKTIILPLNHHHVVMDQWQDYCLDKNAIQTRSVCSQIWYDFMPQNSGNHSRGIDYGDPTPPDTEFVSSLQYAQQHRHDLTNISNQTAPWNRNQDVDDPSLLGV